MVYDFKPAEVKIVDDACAKFFYTKYINSALGEKLFTYVERKHIPLDVEIKNGAETDKTVFVENMSDKTFIGQHDAVCYKIGSREKRTMPEKVFNFLKEKYRNSEFPLNKIVVEKAVDLPAKEAVPASGDTNAAHPERVSKKTKAN